MERTLGRALAHTLVLMMVLVPAAAPSSTTVARADDIADACATPDPSTAQVSPPDDGRPAAFNEFIQPLIAAAQARRARLAADAAFQHRVDPDLNANRVSALLMGFNEEHGFEYSDRAVSVTILSLNVDTWDLASISLSRDTRVPEFEEPAAGPPRLSLSLAHVYAFHGWEGMRSVLEDVTGLSIDFEILMKDVFLRNYVRDVSGPVTLVVPKEVYANNYRLDGVEHPEDFIPAGLQELDTDHAMTFVLAEHMDPHGYIDERMNRKNIMMTTLSCQIKMRLAAKDVPFLLKLTSFMLGEFKSQELATDFDFQLIAGGLGRVAQAFIRHRAEIDGSFPQLGAARILAIADPDFGDGGLRRVHRIRDRPDDNGIADHPLVKQEVAMGSIPDHFMIAIGGNPYSSDLVSDYWGSTREMVARFLQ